MWWVRFDLTSDTGIDRVFGGLGRNLRQAVGFFVPGDPRVPPYPEKPAVPELLQFIPEEPSLSREVGVGGLRPPPVQIAHASG